MRVVRVYHAGRSAGHRARERALLRAGIDLRLIVPSNWRGEGAESRLTESAVPIVELPVSRPGDVNRHRYVSDSDLRQAVMSFKPDLVDVHEEPLSRVMRQVLRLIP